VKELLKAPLRGNTWGPINRTAHYSVEPPKGEADEKNGKKLLLTFAMRQRKKKELGGARL